MQNAVCASNIYIKYSKPITVIKKAVGSKKGLVLIEHRKAQNLYSASLVVWH